MQLHMQIANKARRLLSFLHENASLRDIEEQKDILALMSQVHKVFPQWMIVTCRGFHTGYFYVSDNCTQIIGYDPQYIADEMRTEEYFSQIHEADKEDLLLCFQHLQDFLLNEQPADMYKIRFVLHYRFRHANGQYIYLQDQKMSFILNKKPVHYSMVRDFTGELVFTGVKMEIQREENGSLLKVAEYSPLKASKLSRRETELVLLMRQGFTTKEIGSSLSISPNTVRNMRQKMFEKYKVNNAIELLNAV
ncbi:MAG: PAS domain-containing protein [Gemmatimonadaceae bacterium]|nr:PAS domain-containing protein [Chitinophagaceae bacterium]